MNQLRIRHLALLLAGLAIVGAYFLVWKESLLANLGAGLIVAFFLIFFIENAIAKEKTRERQRVANVALARLRIPVYHALDLLVGWHKASVQQLPEAAPPDLVSFFDESFFSAIRHFDFKSPAPVLPSRSWLAWSSQELSDFRDDLDKVIERYAAFVAPDVIELIEALQQSPAIIVVTALARTPVDSIRRELNVTPLERLVLFPSTQILEEFVRLLLQLCTLLTRANVAVPSVEDLRLLDPKNPPVGTGRVDEVA